MVYLLLGLMPFMVEALPASMRANIEWRGVPFFTGIFTTIIQFLAGIGDLRVEHFAPAMALAVAGAMLAPSCSSG